MFGWIGAILHKVVAVIAGGFAVMSFAGHATTVLSSQSTSTPITIEQRQSSTTPSTEIEQLQQELDAERAARLKLQALVSGNQTKTTSLTPSTQSGSSKTFTTPSGAVLNENGDLVNAPSANSKPNVPTSESVLTTSEIAKLLSPSVALLTTPEGAGSGFVIEGGKYILTNAHVVGSNSTVHVQLPSGIYDAPVLGANNMVDLALLWVGDHKPPAVTLGSSEEDALLVGDDVYALGFPLSITEGLTNLTLTKGILSARQQPTWAPQPLLQTDAAINHGNSGGPMVNDKGEVVGINTYTDAGLLSQTQGIYFAIPIDVAKSWIPELSQYGQTRYELYPIGSSQPIKASFQSMLDLNPARPCADWGFTGKEPKGADQTTCDLYENHHQDYIWRVIQD